MDIKKIAAKVNAFPPAPVLFFLFGITFIFITFNGPVRDFGNYYYGSKLLIDHKFSPEMYTSINYFNRQIAEYGETDFFENYIPVPPFSALFYTPFCVFKSINAKLIFNLLSLLLFCTSFNKLLSFFKVNRRLLLTVPFVFIYPLYTNILQGQSYLLLCALLIEIFISSEKGLAIYPSILLAIIINLKIFPVFILIYFIFKKNYKIVFGTLAFFVCFLGISLIFINHQIVFYYTVNIIPRLFSNDIVGPYYHGNQSIYTALLNLLSYDTINNPQPVIDLPFLVILIESAFSAFILIILAALRKKSNFFLFSFVLFSWVLLGRYNTSYAMLLLLPLSVTLIFEQKNNFLLFFSLACLAISLTLPVGSFVSSIFPVKFARQLGILLVLSVLLYYYKAKLNYKLLILFSVPVFIIKYFTFSIRPITYFPIQNTRGILYDIRLNNNSITLESTLGKETFEETATVEGKVKQDSDLIVNANSIYYKGKLICDSKDNKLKAFIYNDTSIVFMSDLNQACRFYKLRIISFRE